MVKNNVQVVLGFFHIINPFSKMWKGEWMVEWFIFGK